MSNKEQIKIIDITPESLKQDEQILAMCEALQPQMDEVDQSIPLIEIYSRIDQLPEPILRMLAVEHRVYQDEWELAQTLEDKRALIRNSFLLNKRRGTQWAIERIFETLRLSAQVDVWYEYGGDPYHFRVSVLDLTNRGISQHELAIIDRMIIRYKSLRDVVDGVNLVTSTNGASRFGLAQQFNGVLEVYPAPDPLIETFGEVNHAQAQQFNGVLEIYPSV